MNRGDFFKQIIDSYLFFDLKNMAEVKQKDGEPAGAASYPMLATCVSGIELLGGLLYKRDYTAADNWIYFEHYWNNYLVNSEPRYTDYGRLFWKLVRNGVAHTYMAKVGISVTKGNRSDHLIFHDNNNRFNIDCIAFYEDFKKSYEDLVKPTLDANDAFTAQVDKNIAAMLTESDTLCDEILTPLKPAASSTLTTETTTVPGPTPSGINATTTTMIPDDVRKKLFEAQKHTIISNTARASGATLMTQEMAESLKKTNEENFFKQPKH